MAGGSTQRQPGPTGAAGAAKPGAGQRVGGRQK